MQDRYSKILKYLFIVIFVIKALESLTLFSHGDALSYHLVWPKLVLNNGIKHTLENFYSIWLSGYFDFIYFIPNTIFGHGEKAQQAGQFLHFFFSIGLGSLILVKAVARPYNWLAGVALLTISYSADFFLYAKNDGFIALMSLIAFIMISKKSTNLNYKLGLIFGIAIGTKLTALFFTLPLGIYYLINCLKKKSYDFVWVVFVTLLTIFPIMYLKFLYLETPFYPGLLSLFPGNIPKSVISLYAPMLSSPLTFASLISNIKILFVFKAASVVTLFYVYYKSKDRSLINEGLIVCLTSFSLYLFFNGGIVVGRFYFSCFFIITYIAFNNLQIKSKYLILFMLLILIDSKIDKSVKRAFKNITKNQSHQIHIPRSTIWGYVPKNSKVIAHMYTQTYYAHPSIVMENIYLTPMGIKFYNACSDYYDYAVFPTDFMPSGCISDNFEFKKIYHVDGFNLYKLEPHLKTE